MSRSSTWLKGPRCGNDNCNSRLYRIIDGRRVCRNGHVKEGEIEIAYDDGEYQAGTQVRSLNVPSQRASQIALATVATQKRDSLRNSLGKEADAVFMQGIQYMLRIQVEWLIEKQKFPPEYERVARSLWLMYANVLPFSDYKFPNVEDWVKKTDFHDFVSDGDDAVNTEDNSSTPGVKAKPQKSKANSKKSVRVKRPMALDSVSICILAAIVLKLPVSSYDFYRWIYKTDFPYLRGRSHLPKEMQKDLPGIYQSSFMAKKRPNMSHLMYNGILKIATILHSHYNFTLPELNWKPLLFKYTRDLFLPLEFYVVTSKLVESLGLRFDFTISRLLPSTNPEVKLLCIVVIAAKLCFGFDDKPRTLVSDSRYKTYTMDWELYFDMLRKLWIEDECFADMDDRNVMFWNTAKLERFIAWCEQHAKHDLEDGPFTMKRLRDQFPMGKYDESGEHMREADYKDEERLLSTTIDTVFEILRVLQNTIELTDTLTDTSNVAEPGADYISFSHHPDNPQPHLQQLYKSAASLCGIKESYFIRMLRQTEHEIKDLQNILNAEEVVNPLMVSKRQDIIKAVVNTMPEEEKSVFKDRLTERGHNIL